jgi:xylose isomerase
MFACQPDPDQVASRATVVSLDLTLLLIMKYASRLNSFASCPERSWKSSTYQPNTLELIERASRVRGLSAVDLNFPDHFNNAKPEEIISFSRNRGLTINGIAMRYYSEPGFKLGAFTHPDPKIRQAAIDLTKSAMDVLERTDADLLTIWLGQDGWEYPFQADYESIWEAEIEAIREVADHNSRINISIEYKPSDPRSFSLLSNLATTLLAIQKIDRPNLGVTLDFAHVLYAGESPAFAAAMIQRESRLLGIHLNDGYGRRDDGLMVGAVNLVQTLELLFQMVRKGFDGVIYFDTFPDVTGMDPIQECDNNIAMVSALWEVAKRLTNQADLLEAIKRQDAVVSQDLIRRAIFGM